MEILCGGCGRQVEVDDSLAGSRFQCEHCGRIIDVPSLEEEAIEANDVLRPLEAQDDLADDFLTKARLALKKKLLVVCGSCGERLTVEQRLAGKLARCPSCGERIRIPGAAEEIPVEREELMADYEQAGDGLDVARRPMAEEAGAESAALAAAAAPSRPPRRRPARPVRGRRSAGPLVFVVLLVAAATGGLGVLAGYLLGTERGPGGSARSVARRPEPAPSLAPSPPPVVRQPVQPVLPASPPAPLPEPPPLPAEETEPAQPAVAKLPPVSPRTGPTLKVVRARLGVLAADGLLPAPPGKAYLEVVAQLSAEPEALSVDPGAGRVVLETELGKFAVLGAGSGGSLLPLLMLPGRVAVPPTASRVERFVFLVPTDLVGGKLKVAGVGEAELGKLDRPGASSPPELPGRYVEKVRLLRVAFEQPVMEQVRSAGRGELVVRPAKDGLAVELRPVELRGMARLRPDGSYALVLAGRAGSLSCILRPAGGGKRMVLYLDDAPYHQVIYERR